MVVVLAACGSDSATSTSTGALADGDQVDVDMADLAFDPPDFTVPSGATVTFVFHNTDSIDHEALIGDQAAQDDHESEMTSGHGMHSGSGEGTDTTDTTEMDHGGMKTASSAASDVVSVAPGETGELTYTFTEAGTLLLGCHEPGHFDGGMKATITVT
jgi:uncharacterized cupredoxin-like copper-binding protein